MPQHLLDLKSRMLCRWSAQTSRSMSSYMCVYEVQANTIKFNSFRLCVCVCPNNTTHPRRQQPNRTQYTSERLLSRYALNELHTHAQIRQTSNAYGNSAAHVWHCDFYLLSRLVLAARKHSPCDNMCQTPRARVHTRTRTLTHEISPLDAEYMYIHI